MFLPNEKKIVNPSDIFPSNVDSITNNEPSYFLSLIFLLQARLFLVYGKMLSSYDGF